MTKSLSSKEELSHLLFAVWCNDLYLDQIQGIIDHYGSDTVREVEYWLYDTSLFKIILK